MKKVVAFILFILFALFAAVQYNDPDGPAWILIYGAVALTCLLTVFDIYRRSIVLGLILALGLFAIYLAPHFYDYLLADNKNELFGEMVYEKPYIEGTREFVGLVIAIISLFSLMKLQRK